MASKLKRRLGFGCGIIALLGIGFVAGILTVIAVMVGVGSKANDWRSEESHRFITNHFQQVLKLTPEQRAQIEPIIREGLAERWDLRRDYYRETDRLFVENYVPRISEFLEPEQVRRLEDRLSKWRNDNKLTGLTTSSPAAAGDAESAPSEEGDNDIPQPKLD